MKKCEAITIVQEGRVVTLRRPGKVMRAPIETECTGDAIEAAIQLEDFFLGLGHAVHASTQLWRKPHGIVSHERLRSQP